MGCLHSVVFFTPEGDVHSAVEQCSRWDGVPALTLLEFWFDTVRDRCGMAADLDSGAVVPEYRTVSVFPEEDA